MHSAARRRALRRAASRKRGPIGRLLALAGEVAASPFPDGLRIVGREGDCGNIVAIAGCRRREPAAAAGWQLLLVTRTSNKLRLMEQRHSLRSNQLALAIAESITLPGCSVTSNSPLQTPHRRSQSLAAGASHVAAKTLKSLGTRPCSPCSCPGFGVSWTSVLWVLQEKAHPESKFVIWGSGAPI